ncbi:MAG: hypothetical protein IJD13_01560 [Oscillospiraceae bacterium]|nr:hypothetical protein [Oscillospiraceae bacterium]
MKFMPGLPVRPNDAFLEEIIRQKDHIYEVYFSWGSFASGRGTAQADGLAEWEILEKQTADLQRLSDEGIALNILFNGNCYGKDSQSRAFFNGIGFTVDSIASRFGLSSVTTASPLIAKFVKTNFPDLKVRASVNMGIGTVEGMEYIADYFDEYYIAREKNRSLDTILQMRKWCAANGKTLFALANSGCLDNCSAHTFHDNLVSHEQEIAAMDNAYDFPGICRDHVARRKEAILKNVSFIRPEDIHLYEEFFPAVKLATRVSRDPVRILRSYCVGHAVGSLPGLLEPDHTALFYPDLLENSLLPADFGEKRLRCTKNCISCGICSEAYQKALVRLPDSL